MIANITQGSYTKGLLQYHESKIEQGLADVFMTNSFFVTDEKGIRDVLSGYNITSKRKDKNFHVSLNFTQEDYSNLTKDGQKNIIKDYIKGIGFPEEHPYIAYLHKDKKHPHFHIVTSKILDNGKALEDKFIFRKSQRLTRDLEKKYNLSVTSSVKTEKTSTVSNTLSTTEFSNYFDSYKNNEISLNDYLNQIINSTLKKSKPKSLADLKGLLTNYHINVSNTNHKQPGIVFRIDNETSGIAASKINSNFTYSNLEKTFVENSTLSKDDTLFIGKKIDYLFYKYDKIDLPTFKKELAKHEIDLLVNETNNIIRGFAYIYKNNKYKGQDLPGRKYTMGAIKDKFSKETKYNDLWKTKYLLNKCKDTLDYTTYKTFINSVLNNGIKPVIFNNIIYLIPLESGQKPFDNSNAIEITVFEQGLKGLSYEKEQELQQRINVVVDEYFNKDIDNKENTYVEMDVFESVFETLTSDQYFENQESPLNKKKRIKKKNL